MRKRDLILLVAVLALVGCIIGYSIWKTSIMQIPAKAPSDLAAKPVSATEVKLTWKGPNNELGFLLYRDGKEIVELPENTKSYMDSGLRPATSYRYEIKAYNLVGESDTVACSVKTLNPPIQILLEKIGVHECGEEGEFAREFADMWLMRPLTGEIQVGFVITDGKETVRLSVPVSGHLELKQGEIKAIDKPLFETGEVGDYIRLFATAYELDGGFGENLIYKVMDVATGSYFGTPTSVLLSLAGVDFTKIYADIFGAEDDWLGSYVAEWTISDNWGVGNYVDIQCERENGNIGLRLWFSVTCPDYDYSSEEALRQ